MSRVLGFDFGGTATKVGVVRLEDGKLDHHSSHPTETEDLDTFLGRVRDQVAQAGPIDAIGCLVPGFVRAGVVETTWGFIEFLEDCPLATIVEDATGVVCRCDNDARAIAMAEALWGGGVGYARVLSLTIGTGLGVGFTVHGRPLNAEATDHMAGHIVVDPRGPECYCGRRGCLEAFVNASGITRLSGCDPCESFTQSDGWIDDYLGALALGLDDFGNVFAPDAIVFGGGVSKGLAPFLPRLRSLLRAKPHRRYDPVLIPSPLAETAGILGAAALFHDD